MDTDRDALIDQLLDALAAWELSPSNYAFLKVKELARKLRAGDV